MPKEQQKIIKNLYENSEQNSIDISRLEKRIITNKPIYFNKNIRKIELVNKELLDDSYNFSDGISINQEFENFPEKIISNVYVHHQFYTDDNIVFLDGSSIENASWGGTYYYIWKENGENNWIFQFALYNVSRISGNKYPLYFDLSLYFNTP